MLKDKEQEQLISLRTAKLTSAMYLVTNLLSDNEPLKWRLRQLAINMFSDGQHSSILFTVEKILPLLDIASMSALISKMNGDILRREYESLRSNLLQIEKKELDTIKDNLQMSLSSGNGTAVDPSTYEEAPVSKPERHQPETGSDKSRRIKIVEILRSSNLLSVGEIAKLFPECSSKTIQRELAALIGEGSVKRQGDRRWSKYSVA